MEDINYDRNTGINTFISNGSWIYDLLFGNKFVPEKTKEPDKDCTICIVHFIFINRSYPFGLPVEYAVTDTVHSGSFGNMEFYEKKGKKREDL
jgi:hypothetical protein